MPSEITIQRILAHSDFHQCLLIHICQTWNLSFTGREASTGQLHKEIELEHTFWRKINYFNVLTSKDHMTETSTTHQESQQAIEMFLGIFRDLFFVKEAIL